MVGINGVLNDRYDFMDASLRHFQGIRAVIDIDLGVCRRRGDDHGEEKNES
ncbi:MAG: hypothetical protein IIC82_06330 [Chloroflexi bacterium]|nr:hypothetical protein [Chloroflexota bacterium]